MHFGPGLFHTEDPAEKNGLDGGKQNQAECASPEIKFVNNSPAEQKDGGLTQDESSDGKN